MDAKNDNQNHLEQLTWLRGIAAFFVIVAHSTRATEVKYSADDELADFLPVAVFDMGSFGVMLFFVLSGCTLYFSIYQKLENYSVTEFYIKRFFRIWPAFVVSLTIYLIFRVGFASWYQEAQGYWIERQYLTDYSITDLLSYLSLIFNISGPTGLFNNAYWSMPVEFQYYLIFPLIVFSLRIGIIGPVILGMLIYLIPKLNLFYIASDTMFRVAFSFCGGVLVGYTYKRYPVRINNLAGIPCLLFLGCLASAISRGIFVLPQIPILSTSWNWYGFIGIACVYLVLIIDIRLTGRVESFLKHYGTISYSTYLYHNIFIATSTIVLLNLSIHDGNARLLLTLIFTLILSYPAAYLSYRWIEKPSIVFGRTAIRQFVKQ